MGWKNWNVPDRQKWVARKGLEGPFFYENGQVLYYDPKEGRYWDPTQDFYVDPPIERKWA